ncbi:MAG: dodecin [Planctomycetota bacterium]
MTDHTYKLIEIVGTSSQGMDAAIDNAIARAGQTVRNMRWFQVTEMRGSIAGARVEHWQATVKIGFTLDQDDAEPAKRAAPFAGHEGPAGGRAKKKK